MNCARNEIPNHRANHGGTIKRLLLLGLLLSPLGAGAAGNRYLHCRTKSAELIYHTILYGTLAIGKYTVLNGQKRDLPDEAVSAEYPVLIFFNQNRVFRIDNPQSVTPLHFMLLMNEFGDEPRILEEGLCDELPR